MYKIRYKFIADPRNTKLGVAVIYYFTKQQVHYAAVLCDADFFKKRTLRKLLLELLNSAKHYCFYHRLDTAQSIVAAIISFLAKEAHVIPDPNLPREIVAICKRHIRIMRKENTKKLRSKTN